MEASRGPGIETAATICMHCPLTRSVSKDLLHGSQENERKRARGPSNPADSLISKTGKTPTGLGLVSTIISVTKALRKR